MDSTVTTALYLFLILSGLGALAFVVALSAARVVRLRLERAGQGRPWGGRDHYRFRQKYFTKERNARAVRDRTRWGAPPPHAEAAPDEAETRPQSLDYLSRDTLGLLGVELTEFALREAYRRRVREYHPDRVAGLGVKLQVLAEEETKRINDAYRHLKRQLRATGVGQA